MQFEFANYKGKLQAEDLLTPQDNVQTLSRASAQKVKTIFEHDFVKKKKKPNPKILSFVEADS